MKKIRLLFFVQLLFMLSCSGSDDADMGDLNGEGNDDKEEQKTDRQKIVEADWETTEVVGGMFWKYFHFNELFGSNQSVTVFEITDYIETVSIGIPYVKSGFLKTSSAGMQERAHLAVNGSFFNTKDGGPTTYFKNNNVLVQSKRSVAKHKANAGIGIAENGEVFILEQPDSGWEETDFPTLLVSGPLLLTNGKAVEQLSNDFNDNRHPRTAICINDEDDLLSVVVDGRFSKAHGVTIGELTELMEALGCTDAMNLDGGGSTTAWVKGEGVVNYPSDNNEFNHSGERGVATAITFSLN